MARLATPLATTAFAPLWWFKTRTIAGGWSPLRGSLTARRNCVSRSRYPLLQMGQLGAQGGELNAQLIVLLSQSH